jgi:hypothetical protein
MIITLVMPHDCGYRVNEGCLENYEICPQTPNLFLFFLGNETYFTSSPKKVRFFLACP